MQRTNPFPGMNPWLETAWPGVHALLIALLALKVSPMLPDDLTARPEEGVNISSADSETPDLVRADVAIVESWQQGIPPSWNPSADSALEARAAVAEIVRIPPMTERWIEIRDATKRLITVIEIISPSNRIGTGYDDYRAKQRLLLASPINFVEIDLILGGSPLFDGSISSLPHLAETHYAITVKRLDRPSYREIYRPLLRQPLPVIRIPLRPGEKDLFIDLQPLINQVYEAGRYDRLDYTHFHHLPIPAADQAWLQDCLASAATATPS